jgi:hypothetical protein
MVTAAMRSRRLLALAALAFLSACGWKTDGLERLDEIGAPAYTPTGAATVPTGPVNIGTPACHDLGGRRAVRLVQPGDIQPLGYDTWKLTVTDLFLADIDAAGTTLTLAQYCDQQSVMVDKNNQLVDIGKTQTPQALRDALTASPVSISLPGDGTIAASDVVWLWGLRDVVSPLTDVLPNASNYASDSRVWDQDQDGKPGVTLRIVTFPGPGDRYMVRRATWTFAPSRLSFDNAWLTGTLTQRIEESVLGSLLDSTGKPDNNLSTVAPITPRTAGSVYQLRCVGPTYTCAALAQDQAALFAGAPN